MAQTGYYDLLEKSNRFINESGIKKFCSTICKGVCCGGHYKDKDKECDKVLPCVMYICVPLKRRIDNVLGEDLKFIAEYACAGSDIARIIEGYMKDSAMKNAYFENYQLELIDKLQFPDLEFPDSDLVGKIKNSMKEITAAVLIDIKKTHGDTDVESILDWMNYDSRS